MKKILCLFMVALTVACSSDSDNETNLVSSDIVGQWKLVSQTVGGQNQPISDCQLQNPNISFTANGISTDVDGYQEGSNCFAYNYSYNYTVNGNVLTEIEVSDSNVPFQRKSYITNLTESNLQLKVFYVRQENPSGSEDEETYPESLQVVSNYIRIQ